MGNQNSGGGMGGALNGGAATGQFGQARSNFSQGQPQFGMGKPTMPSWMGGGSRLPSLGGGVGGATTGQDFLQHGFGGQPQFDAPSTMPPQLPAMPGQGISNPIDPGMRPLPPVSLNAGGGQQNHLMDMMRMIMGGRR